MKKASTSASILLYCFVIALVGGGFSTATAAAKADWEQRWDSLQVEAKKEGKVTLYAMWIPSVRTALTETFQKKYGISLEFSSFARAEEIAAKVQREKSAGLYNVDVIGCANAGLLVSMKPLGILAPIKPVLFLPEVLDPKAWMGGNVPFTDKAGLAFSMTRNAARLVVYNTNLIKDGELTSVKDLLKPQYKGKITLNDPTVSGAGIALITHLGHNLWGEAETIDFLRRLIKDQEAIIQRDNRVQIESVARGKYAIALGESPSVVDGFLKAKAPIKLALTKEDNRASASNGAFGIPTKFAHPNATALFLNWLLTKEGQSVFATNFGQPSARLDADKEGINPYLMPIDGVKYFVSDNEEFVAAQDKWLKISKQIIEEMTKK